jgi:hypothetical protein
LVADGETDPDKDPDKEGLNDPDKDTEDDGVADPVTLGDAETDRLGDGETL